MTDEQNESAAVLPGEETADAEGVQVEPSVLVWARKSIGLDEERAARKIGVVVSTLRRWESGESSPTLPQLRKAAAAYKRPLAVLLLSEPAKDFDALRDFRAGSERGAVASPELTAEHWRAMSQREVILEIGDLSPGQSEEPTEIPALNLDMQQEDAGARLREWLGVPARWARPSQALAGWIAAAEDRGILVVQTHRVQTSEMHGFSVSAWPHPVVALNGSDFSRRRLFTLAHEIAHLALNAGGLCDLHEARDAELIEDRIELYCNRIAAAALMPRDALFAVRAVALAGAARRWTPDELEAIARPFGTSAESVLLRLVSLNKATWDLYWSLKPGFEESYTRVRAEQRESDGGPSFYVVKARDLGPGYVRAVLDAFRGRTITSLDAADYLDVRYEQIPKLEQAAR